MSNRAPTDAVVGLLCLPAVGIAYLIPERYRFAYAMTILVPLIAMVAWLELRAWRRTPPEQRPPFHWQGLVPVASLCLFVVAVAGAVVTDDSWSWFWVTVALVAIVTMPVSMWRFVRRFGWPPAR